ncbi:MAG TPA: hypothetical protein ENH26_02110 [Candidatus Wolfebacteria bacterium]|nr:hypothetical protein [Candidatus Wolfebacteria bacterium]
MKYILRDKYLRVVFGLSFLILILISCIAYIKLGENTAPLILHFDIYKGIDFLGGRIEAFGILISSFAMILINLLLANSFYNRERFLSYIFGFVSFGLVILILIGVSVIISVN